ncbi:helix-turn-helix transcriptional regulator [Sphingobacterium spiritivorum]|uniref:helix-turn-helix transcriptional regulator n=1 Tax=Sphingobacterium spiritivorum TaxID=258 RepID=UPI003DA6916B
MKDKENQLVTSWRNYPEIFSPEKGLEQKLSLVDLIADFLFTGNYYYYIIDILGQTLSGQHANILKAHGLAQMPETLQEIIDLVHPDDMDFVIRAEDAAHRHILSIGVQHIQTLKCCYCFRMRVADGTYRLFHHQSISLVVDSKFRIVKSLNIHSDIEHITSVNNHIVTVMGILGNHEFHQIVINDNKTLTAPDLKLTIREREILHYIAKGYRSEQIAELLGITTNTCRTHRKNLFRKTGCHSVASLIKKATDLGFI